VGRPLSRPRSAGFAETASPRFRTQVCVPESISYARPCRSSPRRPDASPKVPRCTSIAAAIGTENLSVLYRSQKAKCLLHGIREFRRPLPAQLSGPPLSDAAISPPSSVTHRTCEDLAEIALTFPPASDKYDRSVSWTLDRLLDGILKLILPAFLEGRRSANSLCLRDERSPLRDRVRNAQAY
jgi:hypothetical protein